MISIRADSSSLTCVSSNSSAQLKVQYKFDTGNVNDSNLLNEIVKSEIFLDYLNLFTNPKALELNSITFKQVKMNQNKQIENLQLNVSTTAKDGTVLENYPVTLRGISTVILILMRVGDSPKDMCVYLRKMRPNVAANDYLELPEGIFDEGGKFVGEVANMIAEELQITINKNNLINLTKLAFSNEAESISISKHSDERLVVYLHRCHVTAAKIAEFEEKYYKKASGGTINDGKEYNNVVVNGDNKKQNSTLLKLVPLGDAWHSTSDCKAINAIFLVHELRYHRMMPRFNSYENGYVSSGKKSAQFIKIGALDPMSAGINLRVKCLQPITLLPERVRHDGKCLKEGTMIVGDENGIITLKLSQEQLNNKYERGSPMIIRNGKILMDNGHMMLSVDRWGKIDTIVPEGEISYFDFAVNEENDVSATEFELVVMDNKESDNDNSSPEYTSNQTNNVGRGRRNGGRGRKNRPGGARGRMGGRH